MTFPRARRGLHASHLPASPTASSSTTPPIAPATSSGRTKASTGPRHQDKFIGPGPGVTRCRQRLVAPSDTPDQKLRKIYAAVMKLENTRFTREHTAQRKRLRASKRCKTPTTSGRASVAATIRLTASLRRHGTRRRPESIRRRRHQSRPQFFSTRYSQPLAARRLTSPSSTSTERISSSIPVPASALTSISLGSTPCADGIRQTDNGSDYLQHPRRALHLLSHPARRRPHLDSCRATVTGTITHDLHWRPGARLAASLPRRRLRQPRARNPYQRRASRARQPRTQGCLHRTNSKTTSSRSSSTSTLKGPSAPPPANASSSPATSSKPTPSPPFPTRSAKSPSTSSTRISTQDAVRITFPTTLSVESLPAADKTTFEKIMPPTTCFSESTPNSFTVRRNYVLGEHHLHRRNEYPRPPRLLLQV